MRIFALKIVVENQLNCGVFIAPNKISPLAVAKVRNDLPVDRPVDRPTVIFMTVVATGRPPGRPGLETESKGSLSVDRPVDRD